jgi:hypothetical protein
MLPAQQTRLGIVVPWPDRATRGRDRAALRQVNPHPVRETIKAALPQEAKACQIKAVPHQGIIRESRGLAQPEKPRAPDQALPKAQALLGHDEITI